MVAVVQSGHRHGRADPRRPASPARPAPPRPASTGVYTRLVRLLRPGRQPARRRARSSSRSQLNGFGGSVSAPIAKDDHAGILSGSTPNSTLYGARGRDRPSHRHAVRRPLPDRAQARRGRDGERLPRRGPGARAPGRDQDPRRPPRRTTSSSSSASAARRRTRPASTHPNIVSIFDRGEAEGTYYIAMEFLDGRTLKELDRPQRPDADPDRDRLRAPDPRARSASRTGTGSSTATSSRTTSSSAATGALKVTDFGIARAGRDRR